MAGLEYILIYVASFSYKRQGWFMCLLLFICISFKILEGLHIFLLLTSFGSFDKSSSLSHPKS